MIDEPNLAELRARAGRRGFVTTQDLREVAPIDEMKADDIAMLIVQLEEAGVTVELEEDLLGASRRRTPTAAAAPVIVLPGAAGARRDAGRPGGSPGIAQDAFAPAEPVTEGAPRSASGWRFVLVAAGVIALAAIALFLFSR